MISALVLFMTPILDLPPDEYDLLLSLLPLHAPVVLITQTSSNYCNSYLHSIFLSPQLSLTVFIHSIHGSTDGVPTKTLVLLSVHTKYLTICGITMRQNRSMHVQERPGRAAACCLCQSSSLAASRRVAFTPATMSPFLFVLINDLAKQRSRGVWMVTTPTRADTRQRREASRSQSTRAAPTRATRGPYALAGAASPPPGTLRLLPQRSDRARIPSRASMSFVRDPLTPASPCVARVCFDHMEECSSTALSLALRCVASSFLMFAQAIWKRPPPHNLDAPWVVRAYSFTHAFVQTSRADLRRFREPQISQRRATKFFGFPDFTGFLIFDLITFAIKASISESTVR